jgi:hypothetical protein
MLKTDWKQNLILLAFSFLMIEVLTSATLAFVGMGLLLVFFNIKTTKWIRNILALGVFASYWLTYGKIIDPEVGLNFLTSIIVLKILEKETVRDRYMIFFGLLLLLSAGSLFEKNLGYVFFFFVSFFILIRDFYSYLGQNLRLKDLGKAMVWTLPLTFFLFFLVPRMVNPLPFQQQSSGPGEVGYTPDVNISQIESLSGNQSPVFQVMVSNKLGQGDLYWRGNTLSYNDGWNWPVMVQDKEDGRFLLGANPVGKEIKQRFRLFIRSDYFFTLDFPRALTYGKEALGMGRLRTLTQKRWQWVSRYEAISDPRLQIPEESPSGQYLQNGLTKKEKEKIHKDFEGKSVEEVKASIRSHFLKNGFSYSLSPGKSLSFLDFMEKKIGLCSHYASAVALIMRVKGIPTRLVSGYMGGNYNRFADFYLISENDAHVWVEAHENGQWQRLDPTEWIAPDRVRLGGEAFMESVQKSNFKMASFFKIPGAFQEIKLWFGQWDFLFYQWLEEIDYHSQEAWFARFQFKREWLFSVIPMILVAFMLFYTWYLAIRQVKDKESLYQELWSQFFKKMKKRGIHLSTLSLKASEEVLHKLENPEIMAVWNELVAGSFKAETFQKDLKKKIKKL